MHFVVELLAISRLTAGKVGEKADSRVRLYDSIQLALYTIH
jgi:hypothetical protein